MSGIKMKQVDMSSNTTYPMRVIVAGYLQAI